MDGLDTVDWLGIYGVIDKLAEYEDMEEQGLLLKLPCKCGSTVYKIDSIKYYDNWNKPCYDKAYVRKTIFRLDMLSSIDKSIFLTKEKADSVLERLKNKS